MNAIVGETQYQSVLRRLELAKLMMEQPDLRAIELEMCARSPAHWFRNWAWTYDPRVAGDREKTALMPLDLFPRQEAMLQFLDDRLAAREDGLIEKSRDIGFTWVAGGWALHKFLFVPGHKTTFGSRKGEYVDRIGDPDSILEKVRMLMRSLPRWMLPPMSDKHMLIVNRLNDNTIRGEAGDDMGRGGRSTAYVIDEGAFLEHAEMVDAATSANAECRIWGSSVNGMGNLFARKRHGGLKPEQVFRFHWSDDPRKTTEWASRKRAQMEAHTWASEYEIDYSASVEGIAIPAAWVASAKIVRDLLRDLRGVEVEPEIKGIAGGDVGAGKAKSVIVPRLGPVVLTPTSWTEPDTTETAHKMLDACAAVCIKRSDGYEAKIKTLRFDTIGVGMGVGSSLRRSARVLAIASVGVNVGDSPDEKTKWPDGETSKEKFRNLKAEIWFKMREAFKRTHELVMFLRDERDEQGQPKGIDHPIDEIVCLPPDSAGVEAITLSSQLSLVKWFRTEGGKIIMESKQQLSARGIASPDHADALALTWSQSTAAEQWAKLGRAA